MEAMKRDLVLGLDTSNYTTSLAVVDPAGEILADWRTPLTVNKGERGLRQSYALFQHLENLPLLIQRLFSEESGLGLNRVRERIAAVAVSSRPRPVEGSYMPVFLAGSRYGETAAACLGAPVFRFSHQEGHLAAAAWGTELSDERDYLAYHLSGGTCELLSVTDGMPEMIGQSRDLSFGQVVDRLGVAMGFEFPAGGELDRLALSMEGKIFEKASSGTGKALLKPIPIDGLEINLSGLETQAQRLLDQEGTDRESLAYLVFSRIADGLVRWSLRAAEHTGQSRILFCGGVSASAFIRKRVLSELEKKGVRAVFGETRLSSDNAVGIALLGGDSLWR